MRPLSVSRSSFRRSAARSEVAQAPFDENSFALALRLERKRAERSRQSFLLVLLDLGSILAGDPKHTGVHKIVAALSSAVRETDLVGWYRGRSTLGIVFNDIAMTARKSAVSTLLGRITGILYECLPINDYHQIAVSHHLFPEEWEHDAEGRLSQPELYPDLVERDTASVLSRGAKRVLDITGSLAGLLLLGWLFLILAIAVRLTSRGPVLFRQVRIGQYGKPFLFLKFRSMYLDNDASIHRDYVKALIEGRAERKSTGGASDGVYKLTRDPRITPLGAWLRKSSLDELPQLWNVLKGDMSLVGPRPPIFYEVQAYEMWHRRRVLEAKPGMTGLWQVKGRSRVSFDEMVRLDVRYATSRTLWLDLKILMETPRAVIAGSGAC